MSELPRLMAEAARLRDEGHGRLISYSRKVFIPLTRLCRDVCHYCTFAEAPTSGHALYLTPDEVLAIARAGEAAGCTEALVTRGDQPALRYAAAREALAALSDRLGLEYVGIDCGETPEGKLLIFEVDSGMTVHAMDGVDVFPYKQVQMKKVFRAFREMLEARLSRP